MRLAAVAFLVVGACIIIFGAVWLTVVFPGMEKLPADFKREDTFSGKYSVLNATTGKMDEIPVRVVRARETVRNEGDKAFMTEKVTTTLPTGQPIPQFPPTEANVVVDRVSRLYLPGSDENRSGGLGFPMNVKSEVEYPIWVGTAGRALPAKYNGTDQLEGLEVYRFVIAVADSQITPDQQSGLPRVVDVHVEALVERRSGATVDTESESTISLVHPQKGKIPMFVSALSFTDENVARCLADAKSSKTQLIWVGSYMPWLVMGLGMLSALGGTSLYGLFCWRRMRSRTGS